LGGFVQNRVNVISIPIDSIVPNNWNPNVQSDFMFEKELNSIKEFGFLDPVTVREKHGEGGLGFEIVDGEHRWRAGKLLGMKEIPCNNLGVLDDHVATQLTVILNGTKGQNDPQKLAILVQGLAQAVPVDELLRSLPYTQGELDGLLSDGKIDWDSVQDPQAEGVPEEHGDWSIVSLRLPKDVAQAFRGQVERVKGILHPGEDPGKCSPIGAIKALTRVLEGSSDEAFASSET
jgi:hypothetical protein